MIAPGPTCNQEGAVLLIGNFATPGQLNGGDGVQGPISYGVQPRIPGILARSTLVDSRAGDGSVSARRDFVCKNSRVKAGIGAVVNEAYG